MDRLTKRAPGETTNENGVCCTHFGSEECRTWQGHCEQCSVNEDVWERLAQYEDTALDPQAVAVLKAYADQRLLVALPVPAHGEGWCVHTREDGSHEIIHGTDIAPVLAFQVDGRWNIFSMDKVFPTLEMAEQAAQAAENARQPQEDNIVQLRPKQEGEHGKTSDM